MMGEGGRGGRAVSRLFQFEGKERKGKGETEEGERDWEIELRDGKRYERRGMEKKEETAKCTYPPPPPPPQKKEIVEAEGE